MSSARNVEQLHPATVTYKDHTIKLTHRPRINDWTYTVSHTRTITLTNHAPRYDSAVRAAQHDIDVLLGDK